VARANETAALVRPEASLRITTAADAARLIGDGLADRATEVLRLVYLDENSSLIALAEQAGHCTALPIALGQIVRDSCSHNSRRLLIAHNHPSGDPMPSRADRSLTRCLAEFLRAIDIELVDHLIFARNGVISFRGLGLI
jgi:DNA repair protein RadC